MDELKIRTPVLKALICKLLKELIKKKLGCDVDIVLNDLTVVTREGKLHLTINAEGDVGLADVSKLLSSKLK